MNELLGELELGRPLGLLLLVLLPLVYLLHRRHHRVLATDRLEVWRRALARLPRLRVRFSSWKLVISLLCVLCLALALAAPRLAEKPGYRGLIAVVDRSTSMQTRDASGARVPGTLAPPFGWRSRIQAARERVDAVTAALPEWIPVRLYGLEGRFLKELGPRLPDSLETCPGGARLDSVAALAERAGEETCVMLFADGAGPSPWPEPLPPNLFPRRLGRGDTVNEGILRAELEDPWPGPDLALGLEVRADSGRLLFRDSSGKVLRAVDLDGRHAPYELELPRGDGQELRIELEARDAYLPDNHLSILPRAPWAPRILALPESEPRLSALAAFLESSLSGRRVFQERDLVSRERLLLVDGGSLPSWPEDGTVRLLFGTRLPGLGGEFQAETHPDWDRAHPLLAGLALATVRGQVLRRQGRGIPAGVETLAELAGQPFILLSRRHHLLWIASTLADSNLRVQPFLPVLCLRSLARIVPGQGESRLREQPETQESEIAARMPKTLRAAPVFFRPAEELWSWLLALAMLLLVARACMR